MPFIKMSVPGCRLELQSSTEGSRNQDAVHRTSSDSKVYQQTWKSHHPQHDEEFTAGNSCCQKLTGRSNSSTTEPPPQSTTTTNHGHAPPTTTTTKAESFQCEHGGNRTAAKSSWLSRSPLRAFTSIPATIVAAPNADCSPTKVRINIRSSRGRLHGGRGLGGGKVAQHWSRLIPVDIQISVFPVRHTHALDVKNLGLTYSDPFRGCTETIGGSF